MLLHQYFSVTQPLKITLLGSGWSSSKGGLSTLNRELAIQLSEHAKADVSLLVPEGACEFQEIKEAISFGITVVEAKGRAAYDRLDWLSTPPKDHNMEIVVGHGVKLGRQVQFIRDSARFPNCKWVQVVHTAPEDLGRFKSYTEPVSKGQRKHQDEVELCKLADLVVPVGPRLKKFYSSYLRRHKTEQDVFTVTPGLFDREFEDLVEKQDPNEDGEFMVLLFGRGDDEDFELKGYNIAAQAFSDPRMKKDFCLMFVGAPQGKGDEVTQRLVQYGIAKEQLFVREFIANREGIKDILCEADLAIMPSKSEGFGLVGLEALSAGLPILVGSRSGFAKALEKVPSGKSCIVYSDDPTMWADAIVAVRDRHKSRLDEVKALRESYGQIYSWRRQCEDLVKVMQKMIHGMMIFLLIVLCAIVGCIACENIREKRMFSQAMGCRDLPRAIMTPPLQIQQQKCQTNSIYHIILVIATSQVKCSLTGVCNLSFCILQVILKPMLIRRKKPNTTLIPKVECTRAAYTSHAKGR